MAFLTVIIATDRSGLIVYFTVSVILHELAHLCGMWIVESNPRSVKLIPACIQITKDINTKASHEIFVSLCGPVLNLLLFAVCYFDYTVIKKDAVLTFAVINLILGIFNLLPAKGLDGGDILYNLFCRKCGEHKANIAIKASSIITGAAMLVLGIVLFKKSGGNFSLIIMALYLLISTLVKF